MNGWMVKLGVLIGQSFIDIAKLVRPVFLFSRKLLQLLANTCHLLCGETSTCLNLKCCANFIKRDSAYKRALQVSVSVTYYRATSVVVVVVVAVVIAASAAVILAMNV